MSTQATPWVQVDTNANRPTATTPGLQVGYYFFATDLQQLYILVLVGGTKTWVRAAAPGLSVLVDATAVHHINQGAASTATLPFPLLSLVSLRVSGGAAAAGARYLTDDAGTASATVAKLSDDGLTLTFEDTVTDVFIRYVARLV